MEYYEYPKCYTALRILLKTCFYEYSIIAFEISEPNASSSSLLS